jgi:hypothetical protein
MSMKISGLDDLQKQLATLRNNAERVSGTNEVPLAQLLNSEFLLLNTSFESVEDIFQRGGFTIQTQDDFERIPQDKLDALISAHSKFGSWAEMLQAAAQQHLARELGF